MIALCTLHHAFLEYSLLLFYQLNNYHFLIKKTFWIGATYRFGANFFTSQSLDNTLRKRDALIVMTQFNINPSWVIGYSYTHSLTALSSFAGHEIMLDYTLPRKVETRMKTPRYF